MRVETVDVNGTVGFWLTGRPHVFWYTDERGAVVPESVRLAGNTLLWEQHGLTLRLESALTQDAALRIAATVR